MTGGCLLQESRSYRAGRTQQKSPRLSAEAKPCNQFPVTIHVAAVEVPQLTAPLAHELEKSTTCVEIMLVLLQVFRQIDDAFGEDGHLHFRRTSVARVSGVLLNEFPLTFCCQQPSSISSFACSVKIDASTRPALRQ